jgi:hypothetical protein
MGVKPGHLHRLRIFENMVLRRIFKLNVDGVTAGWRKLHNEALHDLHPSQIKRMINPMTMRLAGM